MANVRRERKPKFFNIISWLCLLRDLARARLGLWINQPGPQKHTCSHGVSVMNILIRYIAEFERSTW